MNRSLTIRNSIPSLTKEQDDSVKKQKRTLSYINILNPQETKDTCVHRWINNKCNYGAEVKALEQGAKAIDDLTDQTSDMLYF